MSVREPHQYRLQVLLVLIGSSHNLIDITASGATHFKLKFFLSFDDVYDDKDFALSVKMKAEQTAELQV